MLSQAAEDELLLLENVFPGELQIERLRDRTCSAVVALDVRPATCDDPEKQLVCVTAKFQLSHRYPEEAAFCELLRPRGLADDDVALLAGRVNSILTANVGQAMLYEVIEVIREVLTNSNVPHGPCPICLEDFDSESAIAKTDCYHHLHIRCLANYINCWLETSDAAAPSADDAAAAAAAPGPSGAACRYRAASVAAAVGLEASGGTKVQRDYPCPVCRMPSSMDITKSAAWATATAAAPSWPAENVSIADGLTYRPTLAELQERERRRELYETQRLKGGIIDVEADRARLHLPPPPRSSSAAASGPGASRQPTVLGASGATAEPVTAFQALASGVELATYNSAVIDHRAVVNSPPSEPLPREAEANRTDGRCTGDV